MQPETEKKGYVTNMDLSNAPPFNMTEMLERLDEDVELVKDIVLMAKEDLTVRIGQLRQAVRLTDTNDAMREAHTIKGVALNICAEPLHLAALDLETAYKNGHLDVITALTDKVETRINELLAVL